MNRVSLLDADMTTVGRWLGEGYAWWMATLAAMLPKMLKNAFSVRPSALARRGAEGDFIVEARGRLQSASEVKSGLAVTLLWPETQCLVREIDLPLMPIGDVRRLVGLDSDRLLPFPPGSVFVDVEVIAVAAAHQRVAIAAIQKSYAMRLVDAAMAAGLAPQSLRIEASIGDRFDFWPALRASRGDAGNNARRICWIVVAVLLVLNLGAWVWLDVRATMAMQNVVTSHASAASGARALRLRIVQEDQRRAELLALRAGGEPLYLLEQITNALPENSWVQQLTLAEGRLRLIGYQGASDDVLARLRAVPRFKSAQPAPSQIQTEGERAGFDIAIDLTGAK